MKNIKKDIFLISGTFGIAIIAILVLTFLYIFPQMKKASNELSLTELNLISTNKEQTKQIENTYERMAQSYKEIGNLFVNPTTPLDLIGFWEKITGEENLIMKISPVAIEEYKYDPWKFLGFEITLSGNFVSIQKFIEKIENSKYLFEINNLSIKKNTTIKEFDEATAIIRLKTYTNQDALQN